jgi:uncharacterized protein RhaS with RHS repeats
MNIGWSPYTYVLNNPINMIDPTGMKADTAYTRDQHGTLTNVGDDGGADFDVITPVVTNDDGSQTAAGDAYTTLFGSAGPKMEMASGQLATLDGADDPFFMLLSAGPFWKMAGSGLDDAGRLGISAFGGYGDDVIRGLWQLKDEGASMIKRHSRFGKLYKSKSDDLWWAVDNAGHGGSKFKVFKESKKGLEWFKDADQYGDFITGKHKGSVGKFIPWGALKTIK